MTDCLHCGIALLDRFRLQAGFNTAKGLGRSKVRAELSWRPKRDRTNLPGRRRVIFLPSYWLIELLRVILNMQTAINPLRSLGATQVTQVVVGVIFLLISPLVAAQPASITSINEGDYLHSGSIIQWTVDPAIQVKRWQITIGKLRTRPTGLFASKMHTRADPFEVTTGQLPADGKPLFVRVSYQPATGPWVRTVFEYQGSDPSTLATLTLPAEGSVLTPSQSFNWTRGLSLVDQWSLTVGSRVGKKNYFDSGVRNTAEPDPAAPLLVSIPSDGKPVYARFSYRLKGARWIRKDYTYTAPAAVEPVVTVSPEPGAMLIGYDTVSWATNEASIKRWIITIGRTASKPTGLYSSGNQKGGDTPMLAPLKQLPANGEPLFLRIRYLSAAGKWHQFVYQYQSASPDLMAQITAPGAGSVLSKSSPFTWQAGLSKVDQWTLSLGSKPGKREIFYSGIQNDVDNTTVDVEVPATGKPVYVRFAYRYKGSAWTNIDRDYVAPPPPDPATITSPESGSVIRPKTTFSWDPKGNDYDQWQLTIGKTSRSPQGLFNSPVFDSAVPTTVTATNLPYNGKPLYVRLRYRLKGKAWTDVVEPFVASDAIEPPRIVSPAAGDAIEPVATFVIADEDAAMYRWRFTIGSTVKRKGDIYRSGTFKASDPLTIMASIPTDLTEVVVELSYKGKSTSWKRLQAVYQIIQPEPARFDSPSAYSELVNEDVITWSSGDIEFDEWMLSVGSSADNPSDYFQTGVLSADTPKEVLVSGLPRDSAPLYARIQYRLAGQAWEEVLESYVAGPPVGLLVLNSPSTRERLSTDVTFDWQVGGCQPEGCPLAEWRFTIADADTPETLLFDSGAQSDSSIRSISVNGLPAGIVAIVNLYSRLTGESWVQSTSSFVTASDLPDKLLSIDDWTYAGAFVLPDDDFGESTLNYSQGVIDVSGDSLFIVGHVHHDAIAEFSIPDLVPSYLVEDLNIADSPIQSFSRALGGGARLYPANPENIDQITGLNVIGEKLLVNAIEYYDAPADNTLTTLLYAQADSLQDSELSDFHALQGAARAAGWISDVPAEWQGVLGAEYLTGFSSGWPIISRLSVGPSLFTMDLQLDQLAGASMVIDTDELLGFSIIDPLHADLSNEFLDNDLWTHLSAAAHGFIVPGTRTYMTIGSTGGHESGVGYKLMRSDGECAGYCSVDPNDNGNAFWLWDLDDMQRVKAGVLAPHEVKPYDHGPWSLPFQTDPVPGFNKIGGAAYDAVTGILYVTILEAHKVGEYGYLPVIVGYSMEPETP